MLLAMCFKKVGIDPTSNEIQAICPTCAQPVRMLRLVDGHVRFHVFISPLDVCLFDTDLLDVPILLRILQVPHAVRRFLQPFEVSTNELMSAYQVRRPIPVTLRCHWQ